MSPGGPHPPVQDVRWGHLFIRPDVFDDNDGSDIPGAHDAQEAARKDRLSFFSSHLSPAAFSLIPSPGTSTLNFSDHKCLMNQLGDYPKQRLKKCTRRKFQRNKPHLGSQERTRLTLVATGK